MAVKVLRAGADLLTTLRIFRYRAADITSPTLVAYIIVQASSSTLVRISQHIGLSLLPNKLKKHSNLN